MNGRLGVVNVALFYPSIKTRLSLSHFESLASRLALAFLLARKGVILWLIEICNSERFDQNRRLALKPSREFVRSPALFSAGKFALSQPDNFFHHTVEWRI